MLWGIDLIHFSVHAIIYLQHANEHVLVFKGMMTEREGGFNLMYWQLWSYHSENILTGAIFAYCWSKWVTAANIRFLFCWKPHFKTKYLNNCMMQYHKDSYRIGYFITGVYCCVSLIKMKKLNTAKQNRFNRWQKHWVIYVFLNGHLPRGRKVGIPS